MAYARDLTNKMPIEALRYSEDEFSRFLKSSKAKKIYQASRYTEEETEIFQEVEPDADFDDTVSQSSVLTGWFLKHHIYIVHISSLKLLMLK